MSDIVRDALRAAERVGAALRQSGYDADFSPASLAEIDRFFSEHSADGAPTPGGLLADDLGARVFALGCYVGEVIRRARGGEWRGDDADPRAEMNVQIALPNGTRCLPVQRAMKRFKNGLSDGIAVYGAALGVPPPPAPG